MNLATRFANLPAPPIESALTLRAGTMKDYHALAEHHYRASHPVTATRVLVLEAPPHAARGLASAACGLARLSPHPRPVGVLVESLPALACRLRDAATQNRYAALRDPRTRADMLNEEIRCISRVVVDPRWRGLGLAVRLVKAALDTATTPYTEALAAMGRVNPFFERAGMTVYRRPPHAHDARLAAVLSRAGIAVVSLALLDLTLTRIDALPAGERAWLHAELHRWHAAARRCRADGLSPRDILLAARGRLLCEPVYYLHRNPPRAL